MKTVQDLLAQKRGELLIVPPETTVRDAVRLMNERGVGSILVGSRTELAGIFTERDLMRRVVDADRQPSATAVGDVMTTSLVTCTPSATISDCATMMSERKIRHLPVLDGPTLLGILTTGDVLAYRLAEREATIQQLESFVFYVRQ